MPSLFTAEQPSEEEGVQSVRHQFCRLVAEKPG